MCLKGFCKSFVGVQVMATISLQCNIGCHRYIQVFTNKTPYMGVKRCGANQKQQVCATIDYIHLNGWETPIDKISPSSVQWKCALIGESNFSRIICHYTCLLYGTARFKLDTRECSTHMYFVTRSECFCEILRVCNYCTRNCRA